MTIEETASMGAKTSGRKMASLVLEEMHRHLKGVSS